MSILRWFAAMISEESVSAENLQKQLHQILLPVVRIVEDPKGAKDPQMGKRNKRCTFIPTHAD